VVSAMKKLSFRRKLSKTSNLCRTQPGRLVQSQYVDTFCSNYHLGPYHELLLVCYFDFVYSLRKLECPCLDRLVEFSNQAHQIETGICWSSRSISKFSNLIYDVFF